MLSLSCDAIKTDVIVIGSGGAGSEAAIGADEVGADVLILDQGAYTKSGSTIAAGQTCCAAIGPDDSPSIHFVDTIKSGQYLNNQKLVEVYVNEAPKRLIELDAWGANFTKREGNFDLIDAPGGHSRKRSVHFGFSLGTALMRGLREELERRRIEYHDNTLVTSLLTNDGAVVGLTAVDLLSGDYKIYKSKSIILATGGAGQIYLHTTMPQEATGSGYGLAYRAGAELVDMEFVQFITNQVDRRIRHIHSGLVMIPRWRKKLRESGLRVINALGEDFLWKYDPVRGLHTTRDILCIACFKEIEERRGPVYMDLTRIPSQLIDEELGGPGSYLPLLKQAGFDIGKELIEIMPMAHHFMGGIKIDANCETSVRGLYAAGEVVGGIHGANRLGGNAVTDILVFGRIAGQKAAQYSASIEHLPLKPAQVEMERRRILGYLGSKTERKVSPILLGKKLQKLMWDYVGVVRNRSGLEKALLEIKTIRENLSKISLRSDTRIYNLEWAEAILLPRMLDTAEMIAKAALLRMESRGAHYRSDYPKTDNKNWLKNIVIGMEKELMSLRTEVAQISVLKPEAEM